MAEKGCIWWDWNTIVAISLFTSVNTRLQLLSKKLWARSTRLPDILINCSYQLNEADKLFISIFSKKWQNTDGLH